MSKSKSGYFEVFIDNTGQKPLETRKDLKLKVENSPSRVKISLQTGNDKFNSHIENKLNKLILSSSTEYKSILELEKVPQLVITMFIFEGKKMATKTVQIGPMNLNKLKYKRHTDDEILALFDMKKEANPGDKDSAGRYLKKYTPQNILITSAHLRFGDLNVVYAPYKFIYKNRAYYNKLEGYPF